MDERGLVGLEARAEDGTEVGRISQVVTDEESGEVTHVLVRPEEGEEIEVPISSITLDPEADFATFHSDPSDDEPGDHLGDEEGREGYAPAQSDVEDREHEGQLVSTPSDPAEAGGWEDEGSNTAESGYPRNDAYLDPETGEEELDPSMQDNETLEDDVEDLISDTDLEARSARDGVVQLTGAAATREDLNAVVQEIMGLDGVLDVDTTDVDVG